MAGRNQWNLSEEVSKTGSRAAYGPFSPENATELFDQIAHLLSDDQREYLDKVLRGTAKTDALMDLEISYRLVTMYSMQAVAWSLEEHKVTRDIGVILGEVRQGAVAIENIKNKRAELAKEEKEKEEDKKSDKFDPTKSRINLDFLDEVSL